MRNIVKKLLCLLILAAMLTGSLPAALAADSENEVPLPEPVLESTETLSEEMPREAAPADEEILEESDVPAQTAEAAEEENEGSPEETAEPSEPKREGETDAANQSFSGSGTETDPYLLGTAADFTALSERVNGGESFAGCFFRMTADVTLPKTWTPVGALRPGTADGGSGANILPFSGTLDGDGHQLTVPSGGMPLFGYVRGATVRGLTVYGKKIAADGLVANYVVDYGPDGIYSGEAATVVTFENVTVKKGTKTLRSGFIGGMDQPEENNEYSQTSSENEVVFINCTVEEGVTVGYDGKQSSIGSFAGEFNGTMTGCVSSADVCGKDRVGGLIGAKSTSMGEFSVTNCQFHGTVTASGIAAGGIAGAGYEHETAPNTRCVCIENCTCDGTVTGADNVGGILGSEGGLWQAWDNGIAKIRGNTFSGKVSGSGNVGGIIGFYRSLNCFTIIENNGYVSDCGAEKGIGAVLYVDSAKYAHNRVKPLGWVDGVYCFDSSEDNIQRIKSDLNPDTGFYNIARTDHNRTDDPLGKNAEDLCYPFTPQDPDDPDEPEPARITGLTIEGTGKTEYIVGENLDTTGLTFTVTWSDGSETHPEADEIEWSGFNSSKPGKCTVTAKFGSATAFLTVEIKPESNKIKVKVAVYGDSRHDSDSDGRKHGLAMGGLTTWVSSSTWEAETSETVWDVLQRVFAANGITARINTGRGTVYVAGLTYRGVSLGEFDNGVNSGWMYTLNGSHPLLGVSQQYLHDGDSIVFHYTDDYTKEQGSEGYDDDEDDDEEAKKVVQLIRAIGSPVTEADRAAVERARAAYDALDYRQKKLVDNYDVLTAAEKKLQELKKEADKAAAAKVTEAIERIGQPVKEDDRARIEAARKAYDALTDEQKALVTNLKKLTEAERALAELEADAEDREKAEKVRELIDAIGDVESDGWEDRIEAARKAYDALTDLQKKLVDNLDVLEKAEADRDRMRASSAFREIYETTGDYIQSLGEPMIGSVGGEWMVIGLSRSGREIGDTDAYRKLVDEYVRETADEQDRLHRAKSTDNSRMILALTAIGADVKNVGGHDLLMGLTDMEFVVKQGINGPSWALIAIDSGRYELPENPDAADPVTREKLVQYLLDNQLEDGGWALSGDMADSDMTGMILQALAPYYGKDEKVTAAVDRALETVSRMQNADGSFSAFGGDGGLLPTSESISQIVVALSALNIDAASDERFIKNGRSVLDALCSFYIDGGGFAHVPGGERDGMATEQGYYALTAYFRMLEGKTALYDMTDVTLPERTEPAETAEEEPKEIPAAEPAEEEDYEEVVVAADTAEQETGGRNRTVLLWGIPAVVAAGAAAYAVDRKRRSRKG